MIRALSKLIFSIGLLLAGASPATPPEGQIVFVSSRAWPADGSLAELYMMNADGSDIRQITGPAGPLRVTGSRRGPSWSLDGPRVAFYQDGGARWTETSTPSRWMVATR